jgi:hypothetical protein
MKWREVAAVARCLDDLEDVQALRLLDRDDAVLADLSIASR